MRNALRKSGADIALLSGSGSALFGVYASQQAANDAGERIAREFPDATVLRAATHG